MFIAKFENISAYLNWNPQDRLFRLRNSLESPAGQILWDNEQQSSAGDLIKLLRSRFGSENQAERFRAELRARRRTRGESLQALYSDICRLLVLAYPGTSNLSIVSIIGRDAFLDALNNPHLRIRILESEPKSLEEALNIACRFEAYERTANISSSNYDYHVDNVRNSGRQYRAMHHEGESDNSDQCSKQIEELRKLILEYQNKMEQLQVTQSLTPTEKVTSQVRGDVTSQNTCHGHGLDLAWTSRN